MHDIEMEEGTYCAVSIYPFQLESYQMYYLIE